MFNINLEKIVIDRNIPGLAPLEIDLKTILQAEGRIPEVGFITPQKAPELLALFNVAYLDLTKHLVAVDFEYTQRERAAEQVRAEILLDRLPSILEKKGLASARSPLGSEDIRQAVLATQPDYQKALDEAQQLNALVELLKGKLKSIEMAYTSVKKVLGEGAFNFRNPNLTGNTYQTADGGERDPDTLPRTPHETAVDKSIRGLYAKARY
jgi:hypothetical protein